MDNIENVSVKTLVEGKFVKPYLVSYTQNKVAKSWEVVSTHPSVSVLIFNKDSKKLVLVRQFRPAVYFCNYSQEERESTGSANENQLCSQSLPNKPGELGITLELCAGIVDKSCNLQEIAKSEVLEECGYDVPLSSLQEIITYRTGVGMEGERQTMFYTEVTNAMKVGLGGGLASEGELIDVIEMSIAEARKYLQQREVSSPGGLLYAFMWFMVNKAPAYEDKLSLL